MDPLCLATWSEKAFAEEGERFRLLLPARTDRRCTNTLTRKRSLGAPGVGPITLQITSFLWSVCTHSTHTLFKYCSLGSEKKKKPAQMLMHHLGTSGQDQDSVSNLTASAGLLPSGTLLSRVTGCCPASNGPLPLPSQSSLQTGYV